MLLLTLAGHGVFERTATGEALIVLPKSSKLSGVARLRRRAAPRAAATATVSCKS